MNENKQKENSEKESEVKICEDINDLAKNTVDDIMDFVID